MLIGNSVISNRDFDVFSKALNDVISGMERKNSNIDFEVQYKPVVCNGAPIYTALVIYRKNDQEDASDE